MDAPSATGTAKWIPWISLGLGLLFGVGLIVEAAQSRSVGSAIKGLGLVVLGIAVFLHPADPIGGMPYFLRSRYDVNPKVALLSLLAWVLLFVGIGLRWTE